MSDAVKRAEEAEPIEAIVPPTDDELAELKTPDPEYTAPIEIEEDEDDEYPEVEETEVTPENYKDFLPNYSETEPTINKILSDDVSQHIGVGFLTQTGQALYDGTAGEKPETQEIYDESEGV